MKHIVIMESYGQVSITDKDLPNSINLDEAEELEMYIKSKGLDNKNVIWGRSTVSFINYVGYIRLSTYSIEILPKVTLNEDCRSSRKALLNMLEKSRYLNVHFSELGLFNLLDNNLFEIFGYLFVEKLEKELKKGMYFDYIPQEENLNVFKGALVIKEQIKNISSNKSKVYCRYDEFSSSNKLNQVFKQVIDYLLRNIKSLNTLKRLLYCKTWFLDVNGAHLSSRDLNDIQFNRLNQRFEESYILAKMLLTNNTSDFGGGQTKAFSILFKMEKVFESYISAIIKEYIPYQVDVQHEEYKLLVKESTNKQSYQLKPDIVISNEQAQLVIDTKWKQIRSIYNRHGIKREDLFQMYAYLTRYDKAKVAILVYPHNEHVDSKPSHTLESWYLEGNEEKKIRAYSIDLSAEGKTVECMQRIIEQNMLPRKPYNK